MSGDQVYPGNSGLGRDFPCEGFRKKTEATPQIKNVGHRFEINIFKCHIPHIPFVGRTLSDQVGDGSVLIDIPVYFYDP